MSYLSHPPAFLAQNVLLIPMIWFTLSLLLSDYKLIVRISANVLVTLFANLTLATMCSNAFPSIQNLWFIMLFPFCALAEKQIARHLSQL